MDVPEYRDSTEIDSTEDEFMDGVLIEIADDATILLNDIDGMDNFEIEHDANDNIQKHKRKRRSNLTEFTDDQTTKRKNECAKRELTSVVKQLAKIDKQLNNEGEEKRACINFVATFNSFKSNRLCTFKYPEDAEIKPVMMSYDAAMSAVKLAVKEAFDNLIPQKEIDVSVSKNATELFVTPTKAISSFTVFPSPVAVNNSQVSSSKNLCGKNSCTFGKRLRKHVWIKCSHRSDGGQSCNYWVHAPCIGFPSLKDEDAKLLDGWCCPDHTEAQMKRK